MNGEDKSQSARAFSHFKQTLQLTGKLNATSHNDILLMRFLRARQYNVPAALKMFEESERWRKEMNVEKITKTFAFSESQEVMDLYPRFYHKTDKVGRSIYIERLGNLDVEKLFTVTTRERLVMHLVREFEKYTRYRLPACGEATGKPIFQGLVILDLLNAPLSQFNSIRLLIGELSSISSNYYPETLGKMVIINAPWLFTAIYSIIKATMLDERTAEKISVLGSNYESELLQLVDRENLPRFLGGGCNCAGGCENSDVGPWNDGSVGGYPQSFWESFSARDKNSSNGCDHLEYERGVLQESQSNLSASSSYHSALQTNGSMEQVL